MTTDLTLSNSLTDLAARIQTWHQAVEAALKDSVHHAIEAGDLLIEAKAQLKHGQWRAWLHEHCKVTERTAQRYMRLARNRLAIEAKYDTVSDLSLNGALAILTVPRETADDTVLDSFVDHLDAEEVLANSLRSQAETARRNVVLEQAELNVEATGKIAERLGIDRTKPVSAETEKFMAEVEEEYSLVSAAYEEAVMSDDYDHAFALAEWLHESTVEILNMAKAFEAKAAEAAQ
jgi:hypothetical protein